MTSAHPGRDRKRMLMAVLIAALAVLGVVLPTSASAAFVSGQQEIWSKSWGTGSEEFFNPTLFGVDSTNGDVYVGDINPEFESLRVQEFSPTGQLLGESEPIPSAPDGLVGIAVDGEDGEFYLLETERELDGELTESLVAKSVLAYSTTPSAGKLVPAASPELIVPAANAANTIFEPRELVLDPSDHDLIIVGENRLGQVVLQRIGTNGSGSVGAAYVETGASLSNAFESQLGVAVSENGTTYLVSSPSGGEQTRTKAYTLPPGFASPLALVPVAGFEDAATAEEWPSGTTTPFVAASKGGRFGDGPQIAVSSGPDGTAETIYFKVTQSFLSTETAGNFYVRGYSLGNQATSVVYGGSTEAEKCAIQTKYAAIGTVGQSLVMLDQGQEVEGEGEEPNYFPEVVRFGPGATGEKCPAPAAAFVTEVGGSATSSVAKGTTVTLNGGASELNGKTLAQTIWKVEGPESFSETVAGQTQTFEHQFAAEGDYTVRMVIRTSALSAIGTTFSAAPQELTVTAQTTPAPTVTAVSPTHGAPGTEVTITGTELAGATAVKFGTEAATGTISVNGAGTQITGIKSPAACSSGTVDITVTTPGGTSTTSSADHFTCEAAATPAPVITGISPTKGPASGGTAVTITGEHLIGATAVKFGSIAAGGSITVNGAGTQITGVISPAGTAGSKAAITVVTPAGTSALVPADLFEYESAPIVNHTLTIGESGTGSGSVTCNGGACASSYQQGTVITLTATAASGSTFAGWSGAGCSGTGSCTVKLEADTSVTATFNLVAVTPPPGEKTRPSSKVTLGAFKQKGTAGTLAATVPGAGSLAASGKGIATAKASAKGSGTVQLKLQLTAAAKKTLAKKGKVTVKVKVSFTPAGGTAGNASKTVTFKVKKAHGSAARQLSALLSGLL